MNELLLNRVKRLMFEHDLSQREFERLCGLSNGSVVKWKSSFPSQKSLQKVSDRFNVSIGWLIGEADNPLQMTLSDYDEEIEVPDIKKKEEVMPDDSMFPLIHAGDRLTVLQTVPENGDLVFVKMNGKSQTCRKYTKMESGIILSPMNLKFNPVYFPDDDENFIIIGKIIGLNRTLNTLNTTLNSGNLWNFNEF